MTDRADQDGVLLGMAWLPSDSAKELANAIRDIQIMRDRDSRNQVVEWVKVRNRAFDPSRDPRDLQDIQNLITACGADDESFDLLLNAISVYMGDDDLHLSKLREVVTRLLPRAMLTKGELRKLRDLKPDEIITAAQLEPGIRKTLGEPTGDQGNLIKPADVRQAVLFLLDVPSAEEGLARLLRFVNWLANLAPLLADQSRADALKDWAGKVSAAHGLTPATWQRPAEPARPAAADDKGVVVAVNPPTEGVAVPHAETEQRLADSTRQERPGARDSRIRDAGHLTGPRYLADHGEAGPAAALNPHDRRLRVLASALKQIVSSIFDDPRLTRKLLNDAESALVGMTPLIDAVSAAAEKESQPERRGELQELDATLREHQEAISKNLTELRRKSSESTVQQLCDALAEKIPGLLKDGKQAIRYVT